MVTLRIQESEIGKTAGRVTPASLETPINHPGEKLPHVSPITPASGLTGDPDKSGTGGAPRTKKLPHVSQQRANVGHQKGFRGPFSGCGYGFSVGRISTSLAKARGACVTSMATTCAMSSGWSILDESLPA
jgi:hypothetical protein